MIFIDDFENDIDYTILRRGKSYYDDGRVVDVKIQDGRVDAVVCGSYDYEVEIEIDNAGNILSADCDCPYDFGEFCKHEVAMFYYIREYFRHNKSAKDGADLKSLLMKQNKETLADIICDELSQHKSKLKEKLIARFTEFSDSAEDCEKIIWKHLNASKVNGRICAEDLEEALEGAYKVFDIAEKFETINYIEAAKRYFKIIDIITSVEVYFYEYDWFDRDGYSWTSGFYNKDKGTCPDEIINLVYSVIQKIGTLSKYDKDNTLFKLVYEKMDYDMYSCYYDACICFCRKGENRKIIEKMISNIPDENEMLHRRYELIKRFDDRQTEDEFLKQNINLAYFRNIAIHNAMNNEDYKKVIVLTESCECCVDSYRMYLQQWRKMSEKACMNIGDISKRKKYLIEFIRNGEFDYNSQLKQICTPEEWKATLRKILDEFKRKDYNMYESLLKKEKMIDELFTNCKFNVLKMLHNYMYFKSYDYNEVTNIFFSACIIKAEALHNRNAYRKLCETIKAFGKIYGAENVTPIIDKLKTNHKRQRAFIDELTKIEKPPKQKRVSMVESLIGVIQNDNSSEEIKAERINRIIRK